MVEQQDLGTALEFLRSSGVPFDPQSFNESNEERPGRQMPITIYDKAPDFALLEHVEELLTVGTGEKRNRDLYRVLEAEAASRNVSPLTLLRNEMAIAMLDGAFDKIEIPEKIAESDKRTGVDNNAKDPSVMRLKAILRQPTANMFISVANFFKLNNKATLCIFVSHLFKADEAIKRIRAAEQAQKDEDELKLMKPAEWFQKMTRR